MQADREAEQEEIAEEQREEEEREMRKERLANIQSRIARRDVDDDDPSKAAHTQLPRSLAVKLKIDMAKLFERPPKTNEQMYDVTVAQQWERDSARKERLARSRAHAMSKVGTY